MKRNKSAMAISVQKPLSVRLGRQKFLLLMLVPGLI